MPLGWCHQYRSVLFINSSQQLRAHISSGSNSARKQHRWVVDRSQLAWPQLALSTQSCRCPQRTDRDPSTATTVKTHHHLSPQVRLISLLRTVPSGVQRPPRVLRQYPCFLRYACGWVINFNNRTSFQVTCSQCICGHEAFLGSLSTDNPNFPQFAWQKPAWDPLAEKNI